MAACIVPPPGMRCIVIDDLRLPFLIGINAEEQGVRQEVSFTLCLLVDDVPEGRHSDNIADHVSYAEVVGRLKDLSQAGEHINLVETLAEAAAAFALADPRVVSVVADVRKTEVIPQARGVGVVIHRHRAPHADGARAP